jgi:hypothetical protein
MKYIELECGRCHLIEQVSNDLTLFLEKWTTYCPRCKYGRLVMPPERLSQIDTPEGPKMGL